MKPFKIEFLDHVAIRVKNMEESIAWYKKVLGLKKYQFAEWGPFPVFMFSGKTGIAIFPANLEDKKLPPSKNVKIDHFAFHVTNDGFKKAQTYFNSINIPFEFQDHHFYHSIYLKDPDEHTVELTTLVVDESELFER